MDDSSFLSASATLDYFNNVAATASYSISRYFNEMMTQRQGNVCRKISLDVCV